MKSVAKQCERSVLWQQPPLWQADRNVILEQWRPPLVRANPIMIFPKPYPSNKHTHSFFLFRCLGGKIPFLPSFSQHRWFGWQIFQHMAFVRFFCLFLLDEFSIVSLVFVCECHFPPNSIVLDSRESELITMCVCVRYTKKKSGKFRENRIIGKPSKVTKRFSLFFFFSFKKLYQLFVGKSGTEKGASSFVLLFATVFGSARAWWNYLWYF